MFCLLVVSFRLSKYRCKWLTGKNRLQNNYILMRTLNTMMRMLSVFEAHFEGAAEAQWLRRSTCPQRTWVQIPLVSMWVIGGGRKGIRSKLLPCASKSRTLVGTSKPLNRGVNDVKFRRSKPVLLFIFVTGNQWAFSGGCGSICWWGWGTANRRNGDWSRGRRCRRTRTVSCVQYLITFNNHFTVLDVLVPETVK